MLYSGNRYIFAELTQGEVQEWLNWPAWKASKRQKRFRGSNPLLSAKQTDNNSKHMKAKKLFAVLFSAFALLMVGCELPNNGEGDGEGVSDVTFEISVSDITSTGATVSVVPSDLTTLYYFDRVAKSAYDSFKGNNIAFMEAMVENLREFCEEGGTSLASSLSVGEDSHDFSGELVPSTDYYIFAFAVDSKLNPCSNLSLKAFSTPEVQSSTNTFKVSVNGGEITVTPSNNDPYFWDLVPTETYQSMSEAELMTELIAYYQEAGNLEYYIVQGVDSFDYTASLSVGASYTVCVFGYNGMPTTAMTKYTFTYEGSGSGSGDSDASGTTTLTGNVALNVAEIDAYYYGDYYEIGTNNWEIGFFNNSGYEYVFSEFFTTLGQNTPEGTYTISGNAGNAGTAYAGEILEGEIYPTYYAKFDTSEELVAFALITSGKFSIAKSGTNYTVSLDLADDNGNKVTASYTGAITVAKGEVSSSQASVGGRANHRAARNTLRRFSSVASIRPTAVTPSLKAVRVK